MLKNKALSVLLPLCLTLTACGGGNDKESNTPDGVSSDCVKTKF